MPPSLIEQWQGRCGEVRLELVSHDDPAFRQGGAAAWQRPDLVIASIHTAKAPEPPVRSAEIAWDMVIVDEAHHLRNRTQLWRLRASSAQFALLLTATPVQNNLEELFNLVTLQPGCSGPARRSAGVRRSPRQAQPSNLEELQRLLAEVMVRNRRGTVGVAFTRRLARTDLLDAAPGEQELYDG